MSHHWLYGILVLLSCMLIEVYSRPSNNEYYREWTDAQRHSGKWYPGYSRNTDEYQYDGKDFVEGPQKMEDTDFMLFLKPIAHAVNSKGTAVANPISHVVIARDKTGSIVHSPVAAAIVGPGGVAHAQSDLYLYEYVTV